MMRYAAALIACLALIYSPRSATLPDQPPAAADAATAQRERAYRANNVGVAHLEQFDYKGAEESFREALKLQPDLALAKLNLAIAIFYAGRPSDALLQAREAARELADRPQAHYILGLTARADDKLDEAVAAFERVLKLDPVDAGAKIQLGQIHLQQRLYAEAVDEFQEALKAEPFNVTAAYSVALALTRAGRADEGRAAMQRFESLRDAPYGVTYSQNYLGQGKYAEGIASSGAEPELVDPKPPAVTFSEVRVNTASVVAPEGRAEAPGAVTLFDADGDGDLDLADAGPGGARFFRNDGRGQFTDESARAGLGGAIEGRGVLAGDYDNDGRPDLLVLGGREVRLLRQRPDSTFENTTGAAGLAALTSPHSSAAFADLDHDGDLDIVAAGQSLKLLRNNGGGAFADMTAAAGLNVDLATPVSVAAVDVDNGRDIDLLIAASDRRPAYFRNLRDGTFRESAAEAGFPAAATYTAQAVADVNKDGYVDVLFARRDAPAVLALSAGGGRFRTQDAPDETRDARAAQFADYDNDGLLDLVMMFAKDVRVFRNIGGDRWPEAASARFRSKDADGPAWQAMALGDADSDGDTDVMVRESGGALKLFRNDGGSAKSSLLVRLVSRVSNRAALGARVEMRAGSLRQTLETSSSTPGVAPADLRFGLGARQAPDVARVLWPSGILQAETSFDEATAAPKPASAKADLSRRSAITITELDRKPSSCPYLFTWNGSRFEFVTDFMGGGEMGAWLAPAVWNQPDPDEYVRITADQLRPANGRYEVRLTNELEEALFFDRVQLLAVDHEPDVAVYPNEGLRSAPRPPFALTATRNARPPARARDEHGHDVLPLLTAIDRRYPDDFRTLPIRGYAEPHELVLDLGPAAGDVALLMTGWTDYAFSNDNVAASQAGVAMKPPSLQVKDPAGQWRTVVEEIGFPVGRPQTVVLNLSGRLLSSARQVRILTNMRIYWDQILVADRSPASGVTIARLDAASAVLRERGMSQEVTPDGREPFAYDYERVSASHPWKTMVGRYTRAGDVRELLGEVDDLFVVSKPGDEVALSFPALPPARAGRARTFLLYADGYSKEMNPRSAIPDAVEPLPFRAMSGYPYGAGDAYPRTTKHREYQDRYNTRLVARPIPSIDAWLARGAK